jgi:hypothetical protein
MNLRPVILGFFVTLTLLLAFLSSASSMDDPGFIINRMVICEKVADKEPVAIADTFSANTEKVYCFLEVGEIESDTTVSFVWYFEGKEMAHVSLPLTKGLRWRTYSSKKLAGLKGNWKVELRESSGIVLNSTSFLVQ